MKTDSLFYRLFQNHPSLVFELLGDAPPSSGSYTFGSQEVKQLSFRIDGILNPSSDAPDLPIVFVEVQGYPDRQQTLYHTFFAEIFLYLRDYQPANDWMGLIIFTKRSLDPHLPRHFQDYVNSPRFKRVYLDELPAEVAGRSLELSVLQLIGMRESDAPDRARLLVERTRQEVTDVAEQQRVVELIVTTLVYKFPSLNREEIRQMLGLDELKETRFYKEIEEEVFARAIPALLKAGLSVEQIAEQLETTPETIERLIQQQQEPQN
jgi:predicted transposase/invertase (TIGR01784 family)